MGTGRPRMTSNGRSGRAPTTASPTLRAFGDSSTRGLAALLSPVALWQGVRVRRVTPRLPEADGQRAGVLGAATGPELRLLVLGESTAVGVGVTDLSDGLGFRLAEELAHLQQRPVAWQVVGRTGATVEAVTTTLLHDLPNGQELIVVVFGVNDTLRLRSRRMWRRHLKRLLAELRPSLAADGRIAVLGVPDFATLPALPQPLRTVLHRHARALDREVIRIVAGIPGGMHVPAIPLPPGDYLSHDRFHPNAAAYAVWAAHIADVVTRLSEPAPGRRV